MSTQKRNLQMARITSRSLSIAICMAFGLFLSSCGGGSSNSGDANNPVIKGTLTNCFGDSIRLFSVMGSEFTQIASSKLEKSDKGRTFELKTSVPQPGFYQIGMDKQNSVMILLGDDGTIDFTGNCANLAANHEIASPSNVSYKSFLVRAQENQQKTGMLRQNIQVMGMSDPSQVGQLQAQLAQEGKSYESYLDSLKKTGGVLGKLASVYSFKPYDGVSHPSEADYFINEFFKSIDLADASLTYIPHLHDKAQVYASNLAQIGLPEANVKDALNKIVEKAPQGSRTRALILLGFASGLDQAKSDIMVFYGNKFQSEFPAEVALNAQLAGRIQEKQRMMTGSPAPMFTLDTPDGKTMGPADFKGKVLLLDFWASWCRPCRMENPNVVKVYAKYKSKGFDILSISLDNMKDKWLTAIDQDNLTWSHVSDLKGWQSSVAAMYGVKSIPSTFLLDAEGNILAKNLRGAALESKLEEIFTN